MFCNCYAVIWKVNKQHLLLWSKIRVWRMVFKCDAEYFGAQLPDGVLNTWIQNFTLLLCVLPFYLILLGLWYEAFNSGISLVLYIFILYIPIFIYSHKVPRVYTSPTAWTITIEKTHNESMFYLALIHITL